MRGAPVLSRCLPSIRRGDGLDALYLLVPLSILLVLGIGGVLAWSVLSGQFEDLEDEGRKILDEGAGEKKSPGD